MALEASRRLPQIRYCSWNIAVTEKGPALIEGNWDAEFYAEQMIMRKGVRREYAKKLGGKQWR